MRRQVRRARLLLPALPGLPHGRRRVRRLWAAARAVGDGPLRQPAAGRGRAAPAARRRDGALPDVQLLLCKGGAARAPAHAARRRHRRRLLALDAHRDATRRPRFEDAAVQTRGELRLWLRADARRGRRLERRRPRAEACQDLRDGEAHGCVRSCERATTFRTSTRCTWPRRGADALGLGAAVGTFDVGKRFDAVVLAASASPCLLPFEGGVAEDADDVLHKLLTLGDDRNVKAVCSWEASSSCNATGARVVYHIVYSKTMDFRRGHIWHPRFPSTRRRLPTVHTAPRMRSLTQNKPCPSWPGASPGASCRCCRCRGCPSTACPSNRRCPP